MGFAPLDDTGTQLLFRLVAAAYERRSLAITSHWSFEDWGRFLPEHTTAVSLLDRLLHHATTVVTKGTQTVFAGQGRWVAVVGLGWVEWRGALGFVVEGDAQPDLDVLVSRVGTDFSVVV